MYHIVADSGCDIFTLNDASFSTVPLTISSEQKDFVDDEKLDTEAMIEYFLSHKGRSFTACPSTDGWLRAFDLPDGSAPDELYIVTLTSGLSGTFNSANVARDIYLEDHPDTKVLIVDSLSVGPEMVLILEKIADLKRKNHSFEEVSASIKDYCNSTRLFFAFKSLHNLAENGRVKKIIAAAAGVLGISVIGTASAEGQIESIGKARSDKNVIGTFLNQMLAAGYKGGKVRISHTENEAFAIKVKAAVLTLYPDADVSYHPVRGLCSYYCERGGLCIGFETL